VQPTPQDGPGNGSTPPVGTQEDLRRRGLEDQVRLLWAYTRGLLLEFDAAGTYLNVWTNEPSLLARPAEELMGRTLIEVFGEKTGRPFMERTQRIAATGQPESWEYELDVLGGRRWFHCDALVSPRPEAEPRTVAFLIRDITEKKRIEAHLMQAERLATVGMISAAIGHEINNPLAYVMTSIAWATGRVAELVSRGTPDDEADSAGADARAIAEVRTELEELKGILADAQEGTERIRKIARQLGLLVREGDDDLAAVDVRRSLDAAIQMAMNEIRHRARLVREYGETPPVVAQEHRLCQVFLNVLVNAAQAITTGTVDTNEIRVRSRIDGSGRVVVEVADTGGGISPENLGRVFDPFFTTKPVGQGTGLRLAICRDIVTSMGGEIALDSGVGKGTTVRITLPASVDSVPAQPSSTSITERSNRRRLLLVDDERRLLAVLKLALSEHHDVLVANDVREALAIALAEPPVDFILCDLMMPGSTGMDLHAALRQADPRLADRIIFMTGGAFTARARRFLSRVQNPRIEKPFMADDVLALVGDLGGDGPTGH
jgi:two-component system, cell cycle sensor histidine kinase and response regulator CckA